jgi:hypothetical protein
MWVKPCLDQSFLTFIYKKRMLHCVKTQKAMA